MADYHLLMRLYGDLSDLTEEKCAQCNPPYKCCSVQRCKDALKGMNRVVLEIVEENVDEDGSGVNGMKFLSPTGCVLRAIDRKACALWICPQHFEDVEFRDQYFDLVNQIMEAEKK